MNLSLSLFQLIILIGAAQGFMVGLYFLIKPKISYRNILFGSCLIILALRFFVFAFKNQVAPGHFFNLGTLVLLLLVGPISYLFIRAKLKEGFTLHLYHSIHLIPFFSYVIAISNSQYCVPICLEYATLYSATGYGLISLITIAYEWKYLHRINFVKPQFYSFPLLVLGIPSAILYLNSGSFSRLVFGFHPATLPYILLTFVFYRMGFRMMTNGKTMVKQTLSPIHTLEVVAIDLPKYMMTSKSFLDPNMSLAQMASDLKLSKNELSRSINTLHNQNFNEFVNSFRIEAAKQNLIDPRNNHLTIEAIGMQSGFKSKSNFNLLFKKLTGQAPAAYKGLKK